MEKYKCVKTFKTPIVNKTVKKDTIWEYAHGYVGLSEIRLYTENGDDDSGFIDITNKQFTDYFARIA